MSNEKIKNGKPVQKSEERVKPDVIGGARLESQLRTTRAMNGLVYDPKTIVERVCSDNLTGKPQFHILNRNELDVLRNKLSDENFVRSIYNRMRDTVDEVYKALREKGYSDEFIHDAVDNNLQNDIDHLKKTVEEVKAEQNENELREAETDKKANEVPEDMFVKDKGDNQGSVYDV